MNILVTVNDMIMPNKGGGAPRVDSIAKALVKEGHKVYVFAPFGCDLKEAEKELGYKIINMKFIARRDPKKIIKTAMHTPSLTFKMIKYVRKYKINLIFAHNIMSGFPAMIAAKIYGIPIVFDPTDFIAEYIPKKNILWRTVYKTVNYLEELTAKKSNILMTNTKAIKNELEKKHKRNVPVVYDSVDFNKFYPMKVKKNNKFTYIMQGGMDMQDGLGILIPVVKELKGKIDNFQVWIVGDGNAVPILNEQIKNEGLEDYFWFSGWVSQDKVREYTCKSDVGLVILPKDVSGKIRLTLRMLEYWACSKAVIAPRLEAVTEVVNENNGLLYEAENVKSLTDTMLKVYKDEKLKEKLSKEGYKAVKDFAAELQGKRVVEIIKKEGLLKSN